MATQQNFGLYIPSTQVWDTSDIYALKESDQLKELLVRMYLNLNRMAISVNQKDAAIFDTSEFVTGQGWFQADTTTDSSMSSIFRPAYRTTIDFGALPNAGAKSVAHGITCTTSTRFVLIYGTASKQTLAFAYKPIPYVDVNTPANNIQIDVDATNVTITTAIDYSAYTAYIVLEYLQN